MDNGSAASESANKKIKVCCVSDTHGFTDKMDLGEGDLLIHAGDFTLKGEMSEMVKFRDWLSAQKYTHKIIIAGNHELTMDKEKYQYKVMKYTERGMTDQLTHIRENENPNVFIQWFKDIKGCQYLDHEAIELYGYKIFGTPYIPELGHWAFSKNDAERRKLFAEIPSDTDILISHSPPKNILDSYPNEPMNSKKRYGCQILREEVLNRVKPEYHIFGHVHEGYGQTTIDGVNFVNPSSVTQWYRQEHAPIYLELENREAKVNKDNQEDTQTQASNTMDGEVQKAQNAVAEEVTIFDMIVAKQIPATILYEDELCLAFKDINPVAKVHFLVVPKNRQGLSQLSKATDSHKELLGHLMVTVAKVAAQEGLDKTGYRAVINDGKQGCQSVYHLHIHVIGGQQLSWPPGTKVDGV